MTPLPKRKISRQRQGKRRAAIQLGNPTLTNCPNCKQPIRPHSVCQNCGHYKSKQVVTIIQKSAKKKGS